MGTNLLVIFRVDRDADDADVRTVGDGDAVDAANGPAEDVDRVRRVDVLPFGRNKQREQAPKLLQPKRKKPLS